MRTISKTAAKVLDTITADMAPGTMRKIGDGGTFMQVVVERLTADRYSVAHYYEQNGDLCADPEMEFYRFHTGAWAPVAIQQTFGRQVAIELGADGKPAALRPRVLRELCSFTTMWMRNFRAQQDLCRIPAATC